MNSLHKSHTVLDSLMRLSLLILQVRSSDESVLFMIDTNHQLISLSIIYSVGVGYALFLSYFKLTSVRTGLIHGLSDLRWLPIRKE